MPENNDKPGITGILLAAGQGTRFGGDKCLAPLPDGTAMGLRTAQNLAPAVDRLICVVRPDDQVLQNLFQQHGFETVVCEDAGLGMSASLKAGICATEEDTDWLIALADMPFIKPDTHELIAENLRQFGGIISPEFAGKRGHPVGFSHNYRSALLQLTGDQGARPVLARYANDVRVIAADDPGVCQDVDTPDELSNLPRFG